MDLQSLLEKSASQHSHLCPRQVLGVRLGLMGLQLLGFDEPPSKKRLLVIVESDGCFADGVIAATDCTIGHRSLHVEDYGKTAAAFVDITTGQVIRVAPQADIRQKANLYAPHEPRHYFAQLYGYQVMPAEVMFTVVPILLNTPIETLLSHPSVRVNCVVCGEEVINEREVHRNGLTLCRTCAGQGYYQSAVSALTIYLQEPDLIQKI